MPAPADRTEDCTEDRTAQRGPAARRAWRPAAAQQLPVLAAVALGGAIGACARYAAALLWPAAPTAFPWTTLLVNVAGCAVIGVFLTVVTELQSVHPLIRPFFGTGVLGGFTTFSTYMLDIQRLVAAGRAPTALAYLSGTALAALLAVWTGAALARALLAWRAR